MTSLITVPVWIMEPFTILQKIAEIMEYTDLLDVADQLQDPHERSFNLNIMKNKSQIDWLI